MKSKNTLVKGVIAIVLIAGMGYVSYESQAPGILIVGLCLLWGAHEAGMHRGDVGTMERLRERMEAMEKIKGLGVAGTTPISEPNAASTPVANLPRQIEGTAKPAEQLLEAETKPSSSTVIIDTTLKEVSVSSETVEVKPISLQSVPVESKPPVEVASEPSLLGGLVDTALEKVGLPEGLVGGKSGSQEAEAGSGSSLLGGLVDKALEKAGLPKGLVGGKPGSPEAKSGAEPSLLGGLADTALEKVGLSSGPAVEKPLSDETPAPVATPSQAATATTNESTAIATPAPAETAPSSASEPAPPNWSSYRKGKSRYVWLLDNGHGGIIDGVYQTKGKRSPKFTDGKVLYEGEFNREVVRRLAAACRKYAIDYEVLVPTEVDVPLRERTDLANQMKEKLGGRPCILVSVHANAFVQFSESDMKFNSASGIETFFFGKDSTVDNEGRRLAAVFQKHILSQTGLKDRGVKPGNFHMLRESSMPSVLTENGFMTNEEEARLLLDHGFRGKIVQAHLDAMMEIERLANA